MKQQPRKQDLTVKGEVEALRQLIAAREMASFLPVCKADTDGNRAFFLKAMNFGDKDAPALLARIERLEEALRFYGLEENYYEDLEVKFPFRSTIIEADRGKAARTALEETI